MSHKIEQSHTSSSSNVISHRLLNYDHCHPKHQKRIVFDIERVRSGVGDCEGVRDFRFADPDGPATELVTNQFTQVCQLEERINIYAIGRML